MCFLYVTTFRNSRARLVEFLRLLADDVAIEGVFFLQSSVIHNAKADALIIHIGNRPGTTAEANSHGLPYHRFFLLDVTFGNLVHTIMAGYAAQLIPSFNNSRSATFSWSVMSFFWHSGFLPETFNPLVVLKTSQVINLSSGEAYKYDLVEFPPKIHKSLSTWYTVLCGSLNLHLKFQ